MNFSKTSNNYSNVLNFTKKSSAFITLLLTLFMNCVLPSQSLAFKIYRTGNKYDVSPSTTPVVCLAGGASDDSWADGWREMMLKANGGDIVIIRADGRRGGYEPWLFEDPDGHNFPKVNSVHSIVITSTKDSNRKEVVELVDKAELVFIAGGDQYSYLRFIKGTRLQKALLRALTERKVPFGGTSAGTALLGDVIFTAQYEPPTDENSMASTEAILKDPAGKGVSLERGFLTPHFLNQVVTDSHFSQRNRQSRLITFMARAVYNGYSDLHSFNIKAIGVDEQTAMCFDDHGMAKIYGIHSAHFLIGNQNIERISKNQSLHWYGKKRAVKVYSISGTNSNTAEFDLKTWSGVGGNLKYWSIDGSHNSIPILRETHP